MFATLIAGPTASGKSAFAIAEAKTVKGVVINADSMQVYADLAILTARPNADEQAGVPHHLFGFAGAREEYSVGRFLADVAPFIAAARRGGSPLVIVGGTGLYFRAMTEGLVPTPAIPHDITLFWRQKAEAGHDLHAELMRRDAPRASQLHPADTPRLLRAISLHAATGRAYSDWLAENPGVPLLKPGEWRGVFLNPERAVLHQRINARFEAMIAAGALSEVRRLLAFSPALPANLGVMKAHGVPHLAAHLRGAMALPEAVLRGQQDTRAYARRQVIFARKYLAAQAWTWRSV